MLRATLTSAGVGQDFQEGILQYLASGTSEVCSGLGMSTKCENKLHEAEQFLQPDDLSGSVSNMRRRRSLQIHRGQFDGLGSLRYVPPRVLRFGNSGEDCSRFRWSGYRVKLQLKCGEPTLDSCSATINHSCNTTSRFTLAISIFHATVTIQRHHVQISRS